jgi:outer membrane protein assembly factor BamB
VGETLYHQRSDGSLAAYAAADGRLVWETAASDGQAAGPLVSGGMIFDLSYSGIARAFAEPALIARLPEPATSPGGPSAAPSAGVPNPFTFARSFPWPATTIEFPQAMDVGPDGLLYVLDTRPAVTVLDPSDGQVVRTWGSQGSGPGEFNLTVPDDNPGKGDIAVAPDGRVYVADGTNARVQVFTPKGDLVKQFGSPGAGEGQLGTGPSEIVAAADGSIYVLADTSGPLTKFSGDGKFRWRSPAPPEDESFQHGLVLAPNGDVIVACEGCSAAMVIDPETGLVKGEFGDGLSTAAQMAPGPESTIIALQWETEAILLLDAAGEVIGGKYLQPGEKRTALQAETDWGMGVWPVPVLVGDGRAYSFNMDGLVEILIDSTP